MHHTPEAALQAARKREGEEGWIVVDEDGNPLSSLDLKNKMMVDLALDVGNSILEKWKQDENYDPKNYDFYEEESMKLARRTVTFSWGMIEGERRAGKTKNSIVESFKSWSGGGIPTEAFTGEQPEPEQGEE